MISRFIFAAPLIAAVACSQPQAAAAPQPVDAGLSRGIATADSLVAASVGKLTPGAVLLVSQNGKVVHERAFGTVMPLGGRVERLPTEDRYTMTTSPAMATRTMFDMASVTKVMATTFAVMMLVDRGQLDLDAPVNRYLTDFRGPHLDSITVRHLLQHSSGLVQWQPLYYQASNSAQTYAAIRDMPLGWGVGEGRHYSDLGFMLLGYIVEKVSGKPLDQFVDAELYKPLGLKHTTFNPKAKGFKDFAPTEQGNEYEKHMVYDSTFGYRYLGDPKSWDKWRDYRLVGETDDGNSYYANNGVAGHAGLFSTASDLRVLLDLLDKRGTYNGKQYISAATIDRFLTRDNYGHYLGWQYPADMPAGTFMHTGFTGTYVMGVPKYRLSVVLLTNRQMMGTDAKGFFPDVTPLRVGVSKAIVASVVGEDKTSTIGVHFEPTDFQSGIVARSPERRLLLSLSTVGVLCSPTAVRRVQCRQRAPGATPLERRKRGLRASG
jgi:CubicO group peptidase (beta-lactamase class C family)